MGVNPDRIAKGRTAPCPLVYVHVGREAKFWSSTSPSLQLTTLISQIFATLSFGAALRSRQASLLVRFPSHTDAECVRSDAAPSESAETASDPWLTGWNFVTELYKTLEYALDSPQRGSATAFDFLDSAYLSLPVEFREMRPFSGNAAEDRIGYQTANIRVTMQTVKMVLVCHDLSFSEKRAQALQIAESLLEDIDSVPLPYLQAISAPLVSFRFSDSRTNPLTLYYSQLHHLVGIYKLILPITEYALSFDAFSRIRQILYAFFVSGRPVRLWR